MIKHINNKEFDKEVLNSKDIVIVDFYANWCAPCRMLSPLLEEISEEKKVFKVNVDEENELAIKYGIMSIPCVISFKDGKEYKRSIGLVDKETLLKLFE